MKSQTLLPPPKRKEREEPSTLVADRNVHVLNPEFAHRLKYGPGKVRINLDLEVIHALQRLMVFLAEDHLALGRVERHPLHRGNQLLGVRGLGLGHSRNHRNRGGESPRGEEIRRRLKEVS